MGGGRFEGVWVSHGWGFRQFLNTILLMFRGVHKLQQRLQIIKEEGDHRSFQEEDCGSGCVSCAWPRDALARPESHDVVALVFPLDFDMSPSSPFSPHLECRCRRHTELPHCHCLELSGQQHTRHTSRTLTRDHIFPGPFLETMLLFFRTFSIPYDHVHSSFPLPPHSLLAPSVLVLTPTPLASAEGNRGEHRAIIEHPSTPLSLGVRASAQSGSTG